MNSWTYYKQGSTTLIYPICKVNYVLNYVKFDSQTTGSTNHRGHNTKLRDTTISYITATSSKKDFHRYNSKRSHTTINKCNSSKLN